MILRFLSCLILVLSFPLTVHASEGGSQLTDMIYRSINFLVLFGILYLVLSKPLKSYLSTRSEAVQKALDEAKRIHEEAEKKHREYQAKIAQLANEANDLRDTIIKEGQHEKERIIEEAGKAAQRIKEQAKFAAEQEIKKARLALKEETVNLIAEMAKEKIKRSLNDSDHERLAREYLSSTGGMQ